MLIYSLQAIANTKFHGDKNMWNTVNKIHLKLSCIAAFSLLFLSGCGSTMMASPAPVENAYPVSQRIDSQCLAQVNERERAIRDTSSATQFMALANQSIRCLKEIHFYPKHPDNQEGMRLNALAVVNYVKSGDIQSAQNELTAFKTRFVRQDLVFADYTSFVDTATALLEPNLSPRQLAMLNINPTLKSELSRTRQWSL